MSNVLLKYSKVEYMQKRGINVPMPNNSIAIANEYLTDYEIKTIKEMIRWYKGNPSKLIQADLPVGDVIRSSIRVNETVWKNFSNFTDAIDKPKHELVSIALQEFYEKYSK